MRPLTFAQFAPVRVLDGGMATELERHGLDISGPLWSAHILDTAPERIRAVHLDYLHAGADCISTASYQVSDFGYTELGRPAHHAHDALRRSVAIAEEARVLYAAESPRPVFIAASLGPYGAALHNGAEFHGNYEIPFTELVDFHARRLDVLADTEADLVAFETVPSFEEARAIAVALVDFPHVSAWVSFTCRDEAHVAHGEPLADCAALLGSKEEDDFEQVAAVGINCTQPRFVLPLLKAARAVTAKALIAYPNSGELWNAESRSWYGAAEVAPYTALARQWYTAGAQAIGGCCRTTPAHIRALHHLRNEEAGESALLPVH
ncbi:homocysteine S-methyltransferase [Silvibacterium dinghuense]|uniref:S-methylmethionine:homocysteine methyltransferase n=1 Tax=Silvibacterium dinghuense TaxID=1560006 RepID=A0A4Q1SIZ7_9BACT|nr:homocysteine S-methyltransferase [Silvibacterium dinghuense]RXS97608.1 homocysteine S-methyltransferase [Silvibacterium dinghuense]GGH00447.1 homocysteine S-methyltransferase [Silvibacterium dinghuense]